MAQVRPFRAFRYNPIRVSFDRVLTQPYDKISPAMQDKYYAADPHNLIAIEKGRIFASDSPENNVYTRAAETLKEWRKAHILAEEAEPALYVYSQTNTVPHTEEVRERRGFIALGHLYDYAEKVV